MDSRDLKSMTGEPEPHVVGPLQPEPLEIKSGDGAAQTKNT